MFKVTICDLKDNKSISSLVNWKQNVFGNLFIFLFIVWLSTFVSTSYSLEVSSCGLERHLREVKHYKAAIGKNIEVKLYKAVNGNKQIEGELINVNEEEVSIKTEDNEQVSLNLTDISSAKILFNWEE